jgi:hypothetical protein
MGDSGVRGLLVYCAGGWPDDLRVNNRKHSAMDQMMVSGWSAGDRT